METLVTRLQSQVQSELNSSDATSTPAKRYAKNINVVKTAIQEMKPHLLLHPFPDKETEIKYFKVWLPHLYKLQLYFTSMYDLEYRRMTLEDEAFLNYMMDEKKKISDFLKDHRALYAYYILEETDGDDILFIHGPLADNNVEYLDIDENFCQASFNLAKILAYEDYRTTLDREIGAHTERKIIMEDKMLTWLGTKAEAAELIGLFYETKLFGHKGQAATIERMKIWAKESMNVDLKYFNVIDNKNRYRKITSSPLLDRMIKASNARKDRLDP